jgi:hypothetical protein
VSKSFTSLVKFITKYFILCDVILNEIIFLMSFLNSLVFVAKTLSNSYKISNAFSVEPLGFSTYKIISLLKLFYYFLFIFF